MTALELYDAGLIELNKVHAPSLLLDDYNYFINKEGHVVQSLYTRVFIRHKEIKK